MHIGRRALIPEQAVKIAALLVLMGCAAVVGLRTLDGIAAYRAYPPDYDEAVHSLPALQIARDLRRLDLVAFVQHSYTQDQIAFYPFLHSWLIAPFLLVAPADIATARAANLVFLGGSLVIAFCLARQLASKGRWLAGLVGAGLMCVSIPLWVFASLVYLEPAGLLVSLAALACYARADPLDDPHHRWAIAASGLAAAALVTKYPFGVFVVCGIGAAEVVGAVLERRLPVKRWRQLAWPVGAGSAVWFANPAKLAGLLMYSQSQQGRVDFWSLQNLAYYPVSLLSHYASGPLSIGAVLAGVLFGLRHLRRHAHRAMLCYWLAGFALLTFVPQKEIRFAYTLAPAALIMAGVAAAALAAWCVDRLPSLRYRVGALLVLVAALAIEASFIWQRLSFLNAAQEVTYPTTPDIEQAYDYLSANTVDQGRRPYLLNPWHRLNQYAFAWVYYTSHGGEPAQFDYRLMSSGLAPQPTDQNLDDLLALLTSQGLDALVSVDGSPAGQITGWQVIEPLWARGAVQPVASSDPFTLIDWDDQYVSRVFRGDFASLEAWRSARDAARHPYTIQLHIYMAVTQ